MMTRKRFAGLSLTVCLALAVFLFTAAAGVLTDSVTAFAEDRQGASGWQVTFNGRKMESNFTSADIVDEINAMQPGDTVEITITIRNTFDGEADWYMKNEVLEALEDAKEAEGGAYDYLLTYTDTAGELATLFSSEKFGGDGRINGVGLHGATKTLDDYFYLDRMGKNDKGVVKLKVALDGETLVNDYQNTLAKLEINFATELVEDEDTPTPTSPTTRNRNITNREIIKTGDQSKIMLYVSLMLAAGLVLMLLAVIRMKREQEEAALMDSGMPEVSLTEGREQPAAERIQETAGQTAENRKKNAGGRRRQE